MKLVLRWITLSISSIIILSFISCSSTNDVVSTNLFQKRKHQKGFYFSGFKRQVEVIAQRAPKDSKSLELDDNVHLKFGQVEKLTLSAKVVTLDQPQRNSKYVDSEKQAQEQGISTQIISLSRVAENKESSTLDFASNMTVEESRSDIGAQVAMAFFSSILSWITLISSIVTLVVIVGIPIIFWSLLGLSMVFGLIGHFGAARYDGKIQAATAAVIISKYYWRVIAVFVSIFLSSFIFFF